MADDKLEWVFDSLVEFLRGPIWNIPVLTFIEQKSVVFEPGAENEEELKKIHEAYKNLVDFMLGSYMEDLKISPEEFEKSCSAVSKKVLNQFHQSLFQQVWAADDFEIFKRMMTQKNLELQLQALEFLTQKRGSVPDCMEPLLKINEEKEMEEIIKKAIVESMESITPADTVLQEQMKQGAEKEKELLEQAIQQSVRGSTNGNLKKDLIQEEEEMSESKEEVNESGEENGESKEEINESEEVKEPEEDVKEPEEEVKESEEEVKEPEKGVEEVEEIENNTVIDHNESSSTFNNESEGSDNELEKINNQPSYVDASEIDLNNEADKCANEIMAIKIEEGSLESISFKVPTPVKAPEERPWSEGDSSAYSTVQVEVSPLELEKRQNYLRQQRDRILALKKQERARRLSISEEIAQARPKSARAAKKMMREEKTEIDPQTLAFRKTLAAKLRHEVVDKSD